MSDIPIDRLYAAVKALLEELGIVAGDGPPMAYFETDADQLSAYRWVYRNVFIGCHEDALAGSMLLERCGIIGRFERYDDMEEETISYLRSILEPGKPLVWRLHPTTDVENGYARGRMRFVQVPDIETLAKARALAQDPNYGKQVEPLPTIINPFMPLPEYQMSCGSITPDDVQAAADADPKLAAKIEAAMIVGRAVKDKNGKLMFVRLPPALALAIIRAVEDENPCAKAFQIAH